MALIRGPREATVTQVRPVVERRTTRAHRSRQHHAGLGESRFAIMALLPDRGSGCFGLVGLPVPVGAHGRLRLSASGCQERKMATPNPTATATSGSTNRTAVADSTVLAPLLTAAPSSPIALRGLRHDSTTMPANAAVPILPSSHTGIPRRVVSPQPRAKQASRRRAPKNSATRTPARFFGPVTCPPASSRIVRDHSRADAFHKRPLLPHLEFDDAGQRLERTDEFRGMVLDSTPHSRVAADRSGGGWRPGLGLALPTHGRSHSRVHRGVGCLRRSSPDAALRRVPGPRGITGRPATKTS